MGAAKSQRHAATRYRNPADLDPAHRPRGGPTVRAAVLSVGE